MKCFIHDETDAQGLCLKCGRAMCKNCMKFNKYSGLCPKCEKKKLIKRAITCSCQVAILALIFYLTEIYYFDIFHFLKNEQYLIITRYILMGWGAIALIILVVTLNNIRIINKSERKAKATLLTQKPKE